MTANTTIVRGADIQVTPRVERTYLTVDAAAKLTGRSARTIQLMFDFGELAGFRVTGKANSGTGGDRRIALSSVLTCLRQMGQADAADEFVGRYRLLAGTVPIDRAGSLVVEPTLVGAMAQVLNGYVLPTEIVIDLTTCLCCASDLRAFTRFAAVRAGRRVATKSPTVIRRLMEDDRVQLTVVVPADTGRRKEIESILKTARGLSDGVLRPVVCPEADRSEDRIVNGPYATDNEELP